MPASWYDEQGPAADVLHVGDLPDPEPRPGEVRVRVTVSGVNPGDTKKRRGRLGSSMSYPRVGHRVWVYGAQSYRASGTAAQYTVVPDQRAVPLPDHLGDDLGASLGIPGITAHRAVFADGPVDGRLVLVHGVLGGVGSLAAQLARWGGAMAIGAVRHKSDLDHVDPAVASHAVALDTADPAADIRTYAPTHPVACTASSRCPGPPTPTAPNSPSGPCCSTTSPCACSAATTSPATPNGKPPSTSPRRQRSAPSPSAFGDRHPLTDIAKAHERVDAGGRGRVLITVAN